MVGECRGEQSFLMIKSLCVPLIFYKKTKTMKNLLLLCLFSFGGLGTRINLNEKWSMNMAAHFAMWRYQQIRNGFGGVQPADIETVWIQELYFKVGISRTF